MSPCHYRDYPRNWRSEIRPRILARAGEVRDLQDRVVKEARCEQCGVENHSVGVRDVRGQWHTADDIVAGSLYSDSREYRLTRIVLTVAHLDHDYTNPNVRDDRLAAWCQRCHLKYDHREHVEHARQTRERKTGQLSLGLVALLLIVVVPALADPPGIGGMEATTVITWSGTTAARSLRFPIAESEFRALSSLFGVRKSPILKVFASHAGIDIEAAVPEAEVLAAADGTVAVLWPPPGTEIKNDSGKVIGYYRGHDVYGGMIMLDHGGGVFTRYAHLSETFVTRGTVGQRLGEPVVAGQRIARVGNTGRSVREHLHFEVIVNGVLQNPLLYVELPEGGRRR